MGDVDDVGGIFCEQRKYVTGRNEGTGGKNTKYRIEVNNNETHSKVESEDM